MRVCVQSWYGFFDGIRARAMYNGLLEGFSFGFYTFWRNRHQVLSIYVFGFLVFFFGFFRFVLYVHADQCDFSHTIFLSNCATLLKKNSELTQYGFCRIGTKDLRRICGQARWRARVPPL